MAVDPALRLPAVLVVTLALVGAAGALGLLLGLLVAVAWSRLGPVFSFAVAHAVLPVVAPVGLPWLVAFEVGALAVLAAPARDDPTSPPALRRAIPLAVVTLWLLVVALSVRGVTDSGLAAAAAVIAAVAASAYGLHRYELVRLGLVEAET